MWLLPFTTANAQVPNDDIARRLVLQAEQPVASTTTNCTVQWSCVDERLTGKCIEYHNDQWFEFTPAASGQYFVNISGQQCRDTRGVQLVVLTGTPCQPATYRILSCTSLGSQDDVFVALDGLQAGQPYLLNVDGYLRDYCRFNLVVSTSARGLPAVALLPAPAAPSASRVVTLHWSLPDSIGSVARFRVWRREAAEFRASSQAVVAVARSTYGTAAPRYSWTDTVTAPGRYLYQIIAESADEEAPVLVQQQWFSHSKLNAQPTRAPAQTSQQAQQQQKQWERRAGRMRRHRVSSQVHKTTLDQSGRVSGRLIDFQRSSTC
ncbi:hypothetical protein ACFPAF_19610 [Hymenobacter endophyticus]|uniref:Fibronectin type-III domain-containing protein n=1 Tax=Hymenobacter endophyticus TaxID=3076335 RepID=A0ABU3TMQ6_9BACT|nr:hypothetical protein [Hymenobacter endophyticus]MDU0372618.1 hypothetical protein [Hymenobacter endophyticus]